MSFKNAFKILLSKFHFVWVLMLYLFIMAVILSALSVTFLVPVIKSFMGAGIFDEFNSLFLMLFRGGNIIDVFTQYNLIVEKIINLLKVDIKAFVNSALFLVLIAVIAYRFILGLYVIPMNRIIEGSMVDNAIYPFSGMFISHLKYSCYYSLMKMLITTIYDVIFISLIYYVVHLILQSSAYILAPFVFSLSLIIVLSFKYTLLAFWAPAIVTGKMGVCKALRYSIIKGFKFFKSVFSLYIIVWTILLTFNLIIGLFSFGVGFIISIPISMMFLNILGMTIFFNRNTRKYYVEGKIYTPITRY